MLKRNTFPTQGFLILFSSDGHGRFGEERVGPAQEERGDRRQEKPRRGRARLFEREKGGKFKFGSTMLPYKAAAWDEDSGKEARPRASIGCGGRRKILLVEVKDLGGHREAGRRNLPIGKMAQTYPYFGALGEFTELRLSFSFFLVTK